MKSQSIVLLSTALLLTLLVGCVFEPVNPPTPALAPEPETPAEPETAAEESSAEQTIEEPIADPKNDTTVAAEPSNQSSTNETNTTRVESATLAVKLSPREQVEMTPLVEKAVINSPCYQLTWDGIEIHQAERPLSVVKELTLQYREGKRFTVWVHYFLKQSRLILDRESITVTVDDLAVTCNATNFTINWERALTTNN